MEIPVYDRLSRRLVLGIIPVLFLPIAIVFRTFWSNPAFGGSIPHDISFLLISLTAFTAALSLVLYLLTNARTNIDPDEGKVFRAYKLFGWTMYRRDLELSQFDRVSLHRGARGGYRAMLVGREKEVVLRLSADLGQTRKAAEDAASVSGLKLNDQL